MATDAAGQLDVLLHDGDTVGVDGTKIGILEKVDKEGFGGLLEGQNGVALPAKPNTILEFCCDEIRSHFTDQTGKGELP